MANTIYIKRGLFANLPILGNVDGRPELGFTTDGHQTYIGNGTSNYEIVMADKFAATTFLYAANEKEPVAKLRKEVLEILSGQADTDFSINSKKITSLAIGTATTDAVNKGQLDAVVAGLGAKFVADVRAQSNVTTLTGEQTIDGVSLTEGEFILCDNQTTVSEDGMYIVHTGAWGRAFGWEVGTEAGAFYVFIKGGTDDGNGYVCTNDDGSDIIGTNDLVFVQFSAAGGGANKALDNLSNVAINTSLLPASADINLGSASNEFNDLYLKTGGTINWNNGTATLTHLAGEDPYNSLILAGSNLVLTGTAQLQSEGIDLMESGGSGSSLGFKSGEIHFGTGGTIDWAINDVILEHSVGKLTLVDGDFVFGTNNKAQFRDTAIYINSSADGQLDIVADTEIQIAATTIDINGAVVMNSALTGVTNITMNGVLDGAAIDCGTWN